MLASSSTSGRAALHRLLGALRRAPPAAAALPAAPAAAPARPTHSHAAQRAPGLMGVTFLSSPAAFARAAQVATEVCDPLIASLTRAAGVAGATDALPAHERGLQTLRVLDTISDTICKVLDAAECVRNVHGDAAWRAAAEETFHALSGYMYELNAFPPLYTALRRVTDDTAAMARLSPEQARMGVLLRREFERDGIHLGAADRAEIVRLNSAVGQLASDFIANISAQASGPGGGGVVAAAAGGALAAAGAPPLGPAAAADALKHATSDEVRRAVMIASNAAAGAGGQAGNIELLHRLRDERQRLAQRIGFASYAHMMASDRMAGSPDNAVHFLQSLAGLVMPRAAADLQLLAAAKAAHRATSPQDVAVADYAGAGAAADGGEAALALRRAVSTRAGAIVQPWDMSFYSARVIEERFRDDVHSVSQYLPLPAVLAGLQGVMRRVFGVIMVEVPLEPGEAWVVAQHQQRLLSGGPGAPIAGAGAGVGGASPLLLKFVLRHEFEGALGTMYLDPYCRPGKFSGAAHFVVRCGKRLHEIDGGFERAMGVEPQVASVGGTQGQSFQLPIVTLVTNYSPPAGASALASPAAATSAAGAKRSREAESENKPGGPGSAAPAGTDAPILMTPHEVETLFHEFGHALHSLLSRTEFQHLSGTRGALDFVEMPSHLMEYWARDFRSVRTFARHHATHAPMPEELWARVQDARATFAGLDLQQSIATSLFDQALFGSAATVRAILDGPGAERVGAAARAAADAPGAPLALEDDDCRIPMLAMSLAPGGEAGAPRTAPVPAPSGSAEGGEPEPLDSTQLLAAVHARYSLAPHLAGSTWHAGFAHAATYGAGYYTYVYAAALSAAVWRKLFARDPFDRKAGELLRREVLAKGAGADPVAMLQAVLGGPATTRPLLIELGLVADDEAGKGASKGA